MNSYFVSVAVARPLDQFYTYRVPQAFISELKKGYWVRIPFGKGKTHGFVVEDPVEQQPESEIPSFALKEIEEMGDALTAIPSEIFDLCRWAHDYYQSPLGEVLAAAAPLSALTGSNKKRSKDRKSPWDVSSASSLSPSSPPGNLSPKQQEVFEAMSQFFEEAPLKKSKIALLHGVTGSGKTELYIELARKVLNEGKNVIVLVPEIALTTQLCDRLEKGLGMPVGLWHSSVADGRRRDLWLAAREGKVRVIVGARSAVFAPVSNLGLIVVDEEHDPSYKQEERCRYQARDLAVVRGTLHQAWVLLGSATPSFESLERVREQKYGYFQLPERFGTPRLPAVEILDLKEAEMVSGIQAPLAKKTLEAIQQTLERGEQVMIFLNRRGFAAFLLCEDCGFVSSCSHCSMSLTVHSKRRQLRCHWCGYVEKIPTHCPKCEGLGLVAKGAGTESLELELPPLVPGMKALRLDRDQMSSTTRLEKLLSDFRSLRANTLLGTQMLVKGHDFPEVTLVVVVLADALFRWPDFRAPERALQILTQFSGRAGRGKSPGKVIIQTYDADHAILKVLTAQQDLQAFLEAERELRQTLAYPPFGRLARLRFEHRDLSQARMRAESVTQQLKVEIFAGGVSSDAYELMGPSEAFLEKIKGVYRWDLVVKTPQISVLQRIVRNAKKICFEKRWPLVVDVDPYALT